MRKTTRNFPTDRVNANSVNSDQTTPTIATFYTLQYGLLQMSGFMFGEVIRVSECVNANKDHYWIFKSESYFVR